MKVGPVGCSGQREVSETATAITVATSESFARWPHHRYAPVELPWTGAYRFAARYIIFDDLE